jgi:hypothetical protein
MGIYNKYLFLLFIVLIKYLIYNNNNDTITNWIIDYLSSEDEYGTFRLS